MVRKTIAATPITQAVTPLGSLDRSIGEFDHLSAVLAGANALAEELYEFYPENKMLFLLYLIQIAEEHTLKLRSRIDDASTRLRHEGHVVREAA